MTPTAQDVIDALQAQINKLIADLAVSNARVTAAEREIKRLTEPSPMRPETNGHALEEIRQ